MIDVLKRLAELDSVNPQVENKMATVESLMTVSNGADTSVNECGGMMGAAMGPGHSPANISITANSGDELSSMLKDIMSLAGVQKSDASHQEIEFGTPHIIEPTSNDDMASSIDLITKMDDDGEKADDDSLNLKKSSDAEEGHDDQSKMPGTFNSDGSYNTSDDDAVDFHDRDHEDDQEEQPKETWNNSPDPEITPHDYGDRQVKPKPQGFKQRMGDNPYEPAQESVDAVASQLMDEYRQFIGESAVTELTKGAKWKYTDAARKSADDLADQASKSDDITSTNKLINKAIKRQANVRKVEKDLVGGKMHENSVDESLNDIMYLAFGKSAKR